jgi:hypothetical protein
MENWLHNLLLKWRLEGVRLNPPASVAEIEDVETILNFKFPQDFKEFYLQANGFDEWDMLDNSYISLWPLYRIIDEFNERGEPEFVGICDWLMRCYTIGFHRHKAGFFKLHNKLDDASCVDITFAELLGAIDRDDYLIY